MSRNEASVGRDTKSSASRRSVSFPQETRVTYVTWDFPLQKIELRPKTLGERDTHTARLPKSLPSVYPCGAHLGREDRRAWSGLHVKAIKSDKGQGRRPSRSVADVLDGNICLKGLGGRHTSSWVSLDSHLRGEIRGLISNVNGIHNPPTEGLFRSRRTSLRGAIAHQQLALDTYSYAFAG